jgi:surface polysaccharide O-acyltransferase-like enzyme
LPPHRSIASSRRHDLDLLRVGAFLLLILYHIGMFYVPWGWHVKSAHVIPALEPLMGALNPWRLTLLFVISGVATRLMASGVATGMLARQRSKRLLIPLLFGMLVVVAPQSWAEVVEKRGYSGSFLDFWPRYLSFDQSFGLILPTYNHLWFVAYLWTYTMIAIAAPPFAPTLERTFSRLLSGPGLFLAPAIAFGAYRATAGRAWGESHIIWNDGYAHLQYGTAFLLGLMLAQRTSAWEALDRFRLAALVAAASLLAVGLSIAGRVEDLPGWPGAAFAFLREAYAWAAICALFGYAHHYVRVGSRALSILSEAVFPFYIVHQTAIVIVGHFLKPLGLSAPTEATVILLGTIISCAAAYGLAVAVPLLRLPLGLRASRSGGSKRPVRAASG